MRYYIAHERQDNVAKSVRTSWSIVTTDHDLDTSYGIVSYIEEFQRLHECTFLITFYKKLES